jgi:hypothetical protein
MPTPADDVAQKYYGMRASALPPTIRHQVEAYVSSPRGTCRLPKPILSLNELERAQAIIDEMKLAVS